MIAGIGIDLVDLARVASLVARWGDAAGRHILTPDEQRDFLTHVDRVSFLAKRFAVKEAFAKALGTGLRAPVLCTAIGIQHDSSGKPDLLLAPVLADFLKKRGITRHHVSISDGCHQAIAFVILEITPVELPQRQQSIACGRQINDDFL